MMNPLRRLDAVLPNLNSSELKKMAVLWGGSAKLRKDECIAYLQAAFNDPERIDAALARMKPYERATLGLLKLLGGTAELKMLGLAVRVTGTVPVRSPYERRYGEEHIEQSLLERGIVISETGYQYYSSYYGGSGKQVFADERLLARVEPLEHVPLPLDPAEYPSVTTFRRAQNVLLDVLSIARTVDDLGGIGLTKSGELRVNDLRKFARKMGWGDEIEFDGLAFPEPSRAYLSAMSSAGLLTDEGDALTGAMPLEQISLRPASEIVRSLVSGLLALNDWMEQGPNSMRYRFQQDGVLGRFAVLTALRCLPGKRAWVRFQDFERTLFDRIGETFSVGDIRRHLYLYGKTPAEQREEVAKWRSEIRESWEKTDLPWLQAVFQTWLYAFGLVELCLENGRVDRFRLTDLGRAVLWEESAEEQIQLPAEQASAWVVQPNFDVVVYLGSASTEQVAFLEHTAERLQVAQHTAQYRLTRDSVYEGLERGVNADRLIAGLAAGSRTELPGNVIAEIRTWAALRERITVRRRADLLEFPNATTRQNALERGLPGLAVGERFLLLPGNYEEVQVAGRVPQVMDYAAKPVRCLRVSEGGMLTFATEPRDLLTLGNLDLWAEREGEDAWRLTRESVEKATRRGRTLRELLTFLQDRLAHSLPGILLVALRAWTGESPKADMAEAVVLQCAQSDVLDALLASQTLKPHLLGRIGSDTLLVDRAGVDKVKEILRWAGVRVSARITGHRA